MPNLVVPFIYLLLGTYSCFLIHYIFKVNPLSCLQQKYETALINGERDKAFSIGRKYYRSLSIIIGKYDVNAVIEETIKNDLEEKGRG